MRLTLRGKQSRLPKRGVLKYLKESYTVDKAKKKRNFVSRTPSSKTCIVGFMEVGHEDYR